MEIQLSQTQKQTLSQKMIQSSNILQLNNMELKDYLQELVLENPLIDLSYEQEDELILPPPSNTFDWDNRLDNQNAVYSRIDYEESHEDWNFPIQQNEESLTDYLRFQLSSFTLIKRQQEILDYMISSLDSRGYLSDSLEDISTHFSVSIYNVQACLDILQSLEPAGIGARSLSECLLLQLNRLGQDYPIAREIISNHLEELGRNQFPQIMSSLNISMEDVYKNYKIILSLNPKPGNLFCSNDPPHYLRPDITVKKIGNRFDILLNENDYPSININSYYKKILYTDASENVKNYIQNKIQAANWIIQCINRRNQTLYNVVKTIVSLQSDYFIHGHGHLHPLKLCEVSIPLQIHESTVSRAIKNKYLQCSWGLFPLHYFFSKSISSSEPSNGKTPQYVKDLIVDLIAKEDKTHPVSDQQISDTLSQIGISISRRTVAKYRNELHIKDTHGRRLYL